MTRNRLVLAITGALAAAIALGTSAAGGAAGAGARPQHFTLFTANVHGKDAPTIVEAAGSISGIGTETQHEKETARGQTNYFTLHFARGTLRLVAPEAFEWKPDLRSCSATAGGGGTWKITGGTGAYRSATGNGTFTAHGVLLGARGPGGNCLGEKAQPAVNYVTVTLAGTITR